jgi:ubiquinone/menaquinone biosynthesis C-methylase UbiE
MTVACAPARAFDMLADTYDAVFTNSCVGRAQRRAVWNELLSAFAPGQRILEINCGTGVDAMFLAAHGLAVDALDISPRMIAVAQERKSREGADLRINFHVLAAERLDTVEGTYDGAFSNFGGLNCVRDLPAVARQLARLVRPAGRLVICLAGRFCAWELAWYAAHGQLHRALRRTGGSATGRLQEDVLIKVFYPTAGQLATAFAPWFRLRRRRGIGVLVPPSYVEGFVRQHLGFLRMAEQADTVLGHIPFVRALADHALFTFERMGA